jgi:CPA2 family monovalent cation:H+ antiporter-2
MRISWWVYMLALLIIHWKKASILAEPCSGYPFRCTLVIFAALFLIAGFSESTRLADRSYWRTTSGLVLAETEHVRRIEKLVILFRYFLGAIFFFSLRLSYIHPP